MTENLLDHTTEEQQWLSSVKSGSKASFSRLYDKYALTLFGVINGLTNYDTSLSEQILHDSFCAIWQNIKKYDTSRQRPLTWMICIVRTTATETLLKRKSKIRPSGNSVNRIVKETDNRAKNSKSALQLCLNGDSVQEAAKKLDICTDDLKIKLRQELNPHRTSV